MEHVAGARRHPDSATEDGATQARPGQATAVRDGIVSAAATFGRTVRLGARATVLMVTDLATGRFPFREALVQAWFFASVSLLPAILISLPMGVVIAVQVGSLTENVGAGSMAGAVGGMGVMQQIAPLAAALLVGGAGASAIASDLGARTIREEIDALRTMGIDPHRRLVAPRVLAMTVVAPMLAVLVILMSILASFFVASIGQGVAPGSYWLSFGSFASVTDLAICLGKSAIFGYLVAVIASQRGLQARGGPKGVADCVNAAVVLGLLACLLVNLIITQIVLLFVPIGVL
ncbi:MlaE family ABC transporter permease [Nocardia shimofusensis]|uniref:MlaE family ABC transporter permease n=1 Tax=Nocardia shimofusensis TaxID=228596 RepID=UPI0035A24219